MPNSSLSYLNNYLGRIFPIKNDQPVRIYLYPDFSENLGKCNHLRIDLHSLYQNNTVIVEGNQDGNHWIRLSTLPNFQIALCGQLGLFHCYLFFPHLRRYHGQYESMKWISNLTKNELEIFYNHLLIPAMMSVCSNSVISSLPLSFATAQKKAQGKNGHYRTLGINISGEEAKTIFHQIENMIEEKGYFCFNEFYKETLFIYLFIWKTRTSQCRMGVQKLFLSYMRQKPENPNISLSSGYK